MQKENVCFDLVKKSFTHLPLFYVFYCTTISFLRRVFNVPKWSGNKIKCSKILPSGGYRYHTCDAEVWLPELNVHKVIKGLYFGRAGDEKKRLSVQCDRCELLETWELQSLLCREIGLIEYSENLLDQCCKHYVQRKPLSPEKICLYQLTPVPTKKAKDERNISAQSMYSKPKTGNLTNSHPQFSRIPQNQCLTNLQSRTTISKAFSFQLLMCNALF